MIRKIEAKDRDLFYALTNEFYNSDSVLSPIPFKNHKDTFNELIKVINIWRYQYEWKIKG